VTTVGSLAYSIAASTQNFTAGVAGSRQELKLLKQAFLESQSPAEKFSAAIAHLESLAQKFPDKAGPLNATIAKMRAEMTAANKPANMLGDIMGRLPIVVDPISAAFQAMNTAAGLARSGLATVVEVASAVQDKMESLDETAKKARILGVSEADLVGLRRAAADLSGVAAENFDSAFTVFTNRMAQAAIDGTGEAAKALSSIGLSANELSAMTPTEAFLRVADSIEQIQNPAERLHLAYQLLGKSGTELATTLAAGDEEIRRLIDDQLALSQTEFIDFAGIEAANDSLGRLGTQLDSITSLMASEFAPLVDKIAADLSGGFSDATKQGEGLRDIIQLTAFTTAALIDEVETLGSVLTPVVNRASQAAKFLFPVTSGNLSLLGTAGSALSGAASGDNLAALQQRQLDLINKGREKGPTIDEIQRQEDTKAKAREAAKAAKDAKRAEDAKEKARKAAEAKELAEQVEAQKRQMEAARRAEDALIKEHERAYEATRTPAEKLRNELEDLERLRGTGLSDQVFFRSLLDLRERATTGIADASPKTVAAIRAGSLEALRIGTEKNPALDEAKKQTRHQEDMARVLGEINNKISAAGGLALVEGSR
jgi:hypothetical protein